MAAKNGGARVPDMFHVVLVEPEIPPNTGNVAKLCAATGSHLHLVGPLGFRMDDATLKRAGMDYWNMVSWSYHESFDEVMDGKPLDASVFCIETTGSGQYDCASFAPGDYLVFGRETKGLRPSVWQRDGVHCLRIPILNGNARSLNLSNCVAIVLYEALRQNRFTTPA